MEEGASPPRWALDKKLGEDASMEEKKEGEKERGDYMNELHIDYKNKLPY